MVEKAYPSFTIIKIDCSTEFEHINAALKHNENMPRIMHADSFAVLAQIGIAIRTSEPFSVDWFNAPVADRSRVNYPRQVFFEILSITIPVPVLTSRNVVDRNEERKRRFNRAVYGPRDLEKDMHRIMDRERDLLAIRAQAIRRRKGMAAHTLIPRPDNRSMTRSAGNVVFQSVPRTASPTRMGGTDNSLLV